MPRLRGGIFLFFLSFKKKLQHRCISEIKPKATERNG